MQLVHVHLITCHFLVILGLKHFAFRSFLIEPGTWFQRWVARKPKVFVPYFEPMTLGKFRRLVIRRLYYYFFGYFIHKNGVFPSFSFRYLVNRVIMFLIWILVLLSSSTSLSRFKFSSLYTIRRALSFCSVLLQNIQTRQLRQDNGVI